VRKKGFSEQGRGRSKIRTRRFARREKRHHGPKKKFTKKKEKRLLSKEEEDLRANARKSFKTGKTSFQKSPIRFGEQTRQKEKRRLQVTLHPYTVPVKEDPQLLLLQGAFIHK